MLSRCFGNTIIINRCHSVHPLPIGRIRPRKSKSPGSLQSFSCFPLIPGKHKSKMSSGENKSLLIFGFIGFGRGRRLRKVGGTSTPQRALNCLTHRGQNNTHWHRLAMPSIGAYGFTKVKIVVKTRSFFFRNSVRKKDEKSVFGLHCRRKERTS